VLGRTLRGGETAFFRWGCLEAEFRDNTQLIYQRTGAQSNALRKAQVVYRAPLCGLNYGHATTVDSALGISSRLGSLRRFSDMHAKSLQQLPVTASLGGRADQIKVSLHGNGLAPE